MTTPLDGPLRSAALQLIARFGKLLTLRTITSTYDPAEGRTVDTPTDVPVRGILEDFSSRETGEGILRGDKKVTIAAKGIAEPTPESRLLIDGTGWGVISVNTIYAGDLPALFVLQIRR